MNIDVGKRAAFMGCKNINGSLMHRSLLACVFWTILTAASYAQNGVVVRSAKSGPWSSPETWASGAVPTTGARVLIRTGHTVRYDVKSAEVIRVVHIAGTLTFARDRDTRLDAGLIRIQTGHTPSEEGFECEGHLDIDESVPRPALEIGTPNEPMPSKFTALVRLHYLKGMDPKSCPALVCCGGRMDLHGSPMARTWLPLGAIAKSRSDEVILSESAPQWKAGDRIIVTATKGNNGRRETEERHIEKIEGQKITLDQPLVYEHFADAEFRGNVGNLSRNVIIESADPGGVRGHTMYHRNSQGAISYAELRHLGKRDVLGRYAIHYHLVGNTMRGSYIIGASIWDSHNRWITVHGTNHVIVRDCVGYKSVGNGIYLEDGTEILNVFDRNLCVQANKGNKLPKQALPFDKNEGAAFWWANSLNTFTNNITCDNGRYGYRFEATETPEMKMIQPVLFPDGKRRQLDLRCLPFVRFDGNEAHAEQHYGFNLGEGVDGMGPNSTFPFIIRNMKIWEVRTGFRPDGPGVLVENMTFKHCEYGVYHAHYDRHVYRNLRIINQCDEPFNRGHDDDSIQAGSVTVDGLTFENTGTTGIALVQISDTNVTGKAETHIRNIKVINPPGHKNERALVDLGGGLKVKPQSAVCVPVYLHDHFGPGRHAKIVSVNCAHLRLDRLKYGALPLVTGPESRCAEVTGVPFPKLLDPVDDFPPATVVTHIVPHGKDGLLVRGTSTDNGTITKVIINGVAAKATRPNFAEWEAALADVKDGLTIRAHAVDDAGNVEFTPHVLAFRK